MNTIKHLAFLILVLCFRIATFAGDRDGVNQITQVTSGPIAELGPRCSPDGNYLAFEYFSPEHPSAVQVWLMPMNGEFSDASPLLGYTGTSYGEISWSPDGRWLSFVGGTRDSSGLVSSQVFKLNVGTRQITALTKFPPRTSIGAGTSWSKDGRIAFEMEGNIYVASQGGSEVVKLVDVNAMLPGVSPFFPLWSPDGNRIAFVGQMAQENSLYVADLKSHRIEKVFTGVGDDSPSWLDDSRILSSKLEGHFHSSIWMVQIRNKRSVRLTQGFYDISPAASAGGNYLYFSRNMDISAGSASIVGGFHVWRLEIKKRKKGSEKGVSLNCGKKGSA